MNDHAVVVRLRQAALELALASPDEKLTVSSICAAAGVSRDDFYSAASNPIQLLGEALSDELLSALAQAPDEMPQGERLRISLGHVARWNAIYRGPLHSELIASLQKTLFAALRSTNEEFRRRHPDLLPDGVSADDDFAISFLASYMAGGSIASIAFWLEDADADIEGDIDRIVELSRAVAPGFMAPLWSQS